MCLTTKVITHINTLVGMGRIDAIIPDDLEKKLRMQAIEKFGGKKGSLTDALEAAIKLWVEEQERLSKKK